VDFGLVAVGAGLLGLLDALFERGHQVDDLAGRRLFRHGSGRLLPFGLRVDDVLERGRVPVLGPLLVLNVTVQGHGVDQQHRTLDRRR
jgi:hypothetical protein